MSAPHQPPYPEFSSPPLSDYGSKPSHQEQTFVPQPSRYHTYNDYNQSSQPQGLSARDIPSSAHGGAAAGRSRGLFNLDFVSTKWAAIFFGVVSLQAVLCLAFEAYVFGRFQSDLRPYLHQPEPDAQYKTIPTFLTLFIFGFLYEVVVVWDALRMKNTIQVIGVTIANVAMLIYTATQVDQIQTAIDILARYNALKSPEEEIWGDIRGFLIAIPCIIAAVTVGMAFCSWKLYQQFAWDILKHIGADYRMKKRFLHYQIYIALLKFDFFFFLGFMVQFLVVVNSERDFEFGLTIAVIPITIVILLAAAYFVRRENKWGTGLVMICYLGALTYFIFKLVRIYQPRTAEVYRPVRKSLSAFSVITILLILLTIANATICIRNFGQGLKEHLKSVKGKDEEKTADLNSINLSEMKQPQVPSRMTID
ncbi:uncharacterized protein DNG_05066 [Cephalotrichum gorgonifer]|uniref:Uncharacterized protein n=1 Tax=Cephalotrichum gorgonifer TaxID=2041049 RepID=A0AAE8MZR8_9PEZI|nr:uncharacterized protein DNG_05066 [Cephalotrichum gorgonifer]